MRNSCISTSVLDEVAMAIVLRFVVLLVIWFKVKEISANSQLIPKYAPFEKVLEEDESYYDYSLM